MQAHQCLDVSSQQSESFERQRFKQRATIVQRYRSLLDSSSYISGRNLISNKQYELEEKARQDQLQKQKLEAFKNKIENDQFCFKPLPFQPAIQKLQYQRRYPANEDRIMVQGEYEEKTEIEPKNNYQGNHSEQQQQRQKDTLAKLGNSQEEEPKNKQKSRNQELKKIIKQITMRNSGKPNIYQFNDQGQHIRKSKQPIESGYQYYLNGGLKKKQKIERKVLSKLLREPRKIKAKKINQSQFQMDQQIEQAKKEEGKKMQGEEKISEKKRRPLPFSFGIKQKEGNGQKMSVKQNEQINRDNQHQQQLQVPKIVIKKNTLKNLIKPLTEPQSHSFIRRILSYQFDGLSKIQSKNMKITPSFNDQQAYTNTMSQLLLNECLTDIQTRMRRLVQKKVKPYRAAIQTITKTDKNQSQVILQYIAEQGSKTSNDSNPFRELSSASYRIGLLTNCSQITLLSNYGVPAKNNKKVFSILCYIHSGKTQEDKEKLKVYCECQIMELELVLLGQKSRQCWFYDLQRISTHLRQFLAISNLSYSSLSAFIINPKSLLFYHPLSISESEKMQIIPLLKKMKTKYNQSQFTAISEITSKQSGIFLLQGPPGTGKTTTLMALLATHYATQQKIVKQGGSLNKIMICAPSNAAIDLITKKIINQGLISEGENNIWPKILRTGPIESDDPQINRVSFDNVCEKQYFKINKIEIASIASAKQRLVELIKKQKQQTSQQLLRQVRELENKIQSMPSKSLGKKKIMRQIEDRLLNQAEIILTTLNSSGSDRLDQIRDKVELVIIDEAAQATQTSIIIPFQTGAIKLILIGDPKQLPATVLSQDIEVTHYNRSLFERCIDEGVKPYFLNVQYRMDSLIRKFPSQRFYQNRLVDGQNVIARSNNLSLVKQILQPFMGKNLIFLGIDYGEERLQNNSYYNSSEAEIVCLIVNQYFAHSNVSLGVITPYQSQKRRIDNSLCNSEIKVNTVDSFQGQEKDVIIVSTVRANPSGLIGFLNDDRRTNVAITRSKHLLIIIGHLKTLSTSKSWCAYIQFAQKIQRCFKIVNNSEMRTQIDRIMKGKEQNIDLYTELPLNSIKKPKKQNIAQVKPLKIKQNLIIKKLEKVQKIGESAQESKAKLMSREAKSNDRKQGNEKMSEVFKNMRDLQKKVKDNENPLSQLFHDI